MLAFREKLPAYKLKDEFLKAVADNQVKFLFLAIVIGVYHHMSCVITMAEIMLCLFAVLQYWACIEVMSFFGSFIISKIWVLIFMLLDCPRYWQ